MLNFIVFPLEVKYYSFRKISYTRAAGPSLRYTGTESSENRVRARMLRFSQICIWKLVLNRDDATTKVTRFAATKGSTFFGINKNHKENLW